MANAGGLRACIDLVTLLVCCNLLARTTQPDVIVISPTSASAGGEGDLPPLTRLTTTNGRAAPAPVGMDRAA